MKPGSKYRPLYEALSKSGQDQVRFTFEELEAVLEAGLPPSARHSRSWWSNRRSSPQAAAWMGAGYHIREIDLEAGSVVFARPDRQYQVRRAGGTILWDSQLIRALREHMQLSQSRFAEELGVRQQTVSEWETGIYAPKRAMCKYLTLVAEQAGFIYAAPPDEG